MGLEMEARVGWETERERGGGHETVTWLSLSKALCYVTNHVTRLLFTNFHRLGRVDWCLLGKMLVDTSGVLMDCLYFNLRSVIT